MRTYLDHNATSPLKPVAKAAMIAALAHGNASSIHYEGRAARAAVENARDVLARHLAISPSMVVFTSGGTEANNLAIRGLAVERMLASAVEHPSVIEAARSRQLALELVPVDRTGVVDIVALDALLKGSRLRTLVSIMLANNETGALQPLRRVSELCRAHGAILHTDAAQALGKIPVRFVELGVDLMTVSAHKLGGPMGAGALVARDGSALSPQMSGGGQELSRRAGTENVAALAGFAAALETGLLQVDVLRDQFETRLEELCPEATIFSRAAGRLPNTSCFALPGLRSDTVLIALDLDGIAVSTGSACSSGKVARSHVLQAMGVGPMLANSAIRVSLGWSTTQAEVDRLIAALRGVVERTNRIAA